MKALFHVVEGAQIVLRKRGVFKQSSVYRRGDDLYASYAGGYIGVRYSGATTHPDVVWDHIEGVEYVRGNKMLGNLRLQE